MVRRTALISAASVVGVVLAGSTAVGANIGILGQADNSGLGELSASSSPEPRLIDVQLDGDDRVSTTTSEATGASSGDVRANAQPFVVEDAGVVELVRDDNGLRVAAITPNPGWSWSKSDPGDGDPVVTFRSGDVVYVFSAFIDDDGSIVARVDQPVIEIVDGAPATTPTDPSHDDDEYDDDEYDDDEYDDDEYDDDEYDDDEDDDDEEDDEDDEHEGRDDDD